MFLIDTDILIYALKGRSGIVEAFRTHRSQPKFVSAVSLCELAYGAHRSQRAEQNLERVRQLASAFPILGVDAGVAEHFGEIKAVLEKQGQPLHDLDLLIAATALSHHLVLVTNNLKHFSRVPRLVTETWVDAD